MNLKKAIQYITEASAVEPKHLSDVILYVESNIKYWILPEDRHMELVELRKDVEILMESRNIRDISIEEVIKYAELN